MINGHLFVAIKFYTQNGGNATPKIIYDNTYSKAKEKAFNYVIREIAICPSEVKFKLYEYWRGECCVLYTASTGFPTLTPIFRSIKLREE